jgi:tetratricopeptide (TPR) repeat protein
VVLVDTIIAQTYAYDDRAERIRSAEALALQALASAPQDPMAHLCLGLLLVLDKRAEQGVDELTLALSLDPNLVFAHAQIGLAKIALGRAEEAEAHIADALRLSPRDLGAYVWYGFIGFAKLHLGADEEATAWFRKSLEANRSYPISRFHLAAALALRGLIEDARNEARAGLALAPDFNLRRFRDGALSDHTTYLAQRERIIGGMRLAGVPEG